jgi:hypothetical protein
MTSSDLGWYLVGALTGFIVGVSLTFVFFVGTIG